MSRLRRRGVAIGLLPVVLAACAVNPATGRRELMLVSETQEVEMGRDADPSITEAYGRVDNPALQEYVSALGAALAADSERPDLPWTFTVVDDPIVNAFALPGGFIYVTRGILAHFDSEAELAGVLGHEIGHVTARHGASQMSRQQLQQIGLAAGMVLSDRFRAYGGLAAQAVQLMNLSYSRGDESQADRLGLRYISRSGYDADAMIGVFEMLGAASAGGGGRLPEWQMTHPLPENREVAIRQEIAATGASREGTVNRDVYLDMIDGLVWGANPREGYFEGARFFHPELAFEVTFPEGWETVNQRTLVAAVAPTKDAVLTLGAEPESPDPSAALRAFLTSEGVSGGAASTEEVNGFPAARARFRLTTDDETLAGEVVFLRHRDRTYRLLAYAGPDRWAAVAGLADGMFGSFAEVTDVDVLGVQPLRLEVITLREATSLNRWVQSHPQPVDLETLTRLNRIAGGEVLGAGTRIKTVAGTPVG